MQTLGKKDFTSPFAKPRRMNPVAANQRGSALLATLCFAAVLSLSLSSYLALCYRSLVLSNRGMHSTHGMELAEVGMEEALWALNNGGFDGTWTYTTPAGVPTATKTFTPGFPYENRAAGQVVVTVGNYNKTIANFAGAPFPEVTITSVGTMALADTTTITRRLQSNARPAQLFTNAVSAAGALQFGFGGTVDSYDSSVSSYVATVPGALTAANSAAVVSGGTVDVGNAQVYGFAATGCTLLQYQSSGKLLGPLTPPLVSIDPARISQSSTQPKFDVVPPTTIVTRFDPIDSSVQLTHSEVLSTAGNYRYDSILLTGSTELIIDAPVVLKVTNYVYLGGGAQIHVTTNGSLQLQIEAGSYTSVLDTMSGASNGASLHQGLYLVDGGILNDSQLPKNVSVLVGGNVAPDASPHSYSYLRPNQPIYGSIYLPNDAVDIAANNFQLFGAMIGKTIAFSGNAPAIHYDTALRRTGISGTTPFALVQLHEL